MSLFLGEGNEEIGNMIQNYIKEIEELRYSFNVIVIFFPNHLAQTHITQPFSNVEVIVHRNKPLQVTIIQRRERNKLISVIRKSH